MSEYMLKSDWENKKAKEFYFELNKKFIEREIYTGPDLLSEIVIVIGGDGTMLRAVHQLYQETHGDELFSKKIFLGINFGHVGFLMNDVKGNLEDLFNRILARKFKVYRFPLLEIEAENKWQRIALDDVYFNRITGKVCKINVKVNGNEVAERILGDGIVICTALGSTGYFTSVGGLAIYPELQVIGFGPIAHKVPLQLLPLVFPLKSEFEITLLSPPEEVKGFYDGLELPYFQKIKIKSGNRWVKLAFWEEEDFTERLIRKIMNVQEV